MYKISIWALVAGFSTLAVAGETVNEPGLSAPQIVEKNISARGGLEAWQKLQSMVWVGHIESDNAPAPSLSFALEMKRPDKTRFEIKAQNQTSVRMYDGAHGWKLHPGRNGKPDVEPYTAEELNFARDGQGIDGPLMDCQAKGIAVALEGEDNVEGHKAYRLSVKLPSGKIYHVWIDVMTFLDIKYDRQSRNSLGHPVTVSVFNRNYQTIEGLQLPFLIETSTDATKATDKMVIDRISLNLSLPDRMFAKPNVSGWSKAAMGDINSLQSSRPAVRSDSVLSSGFPKLSAGSVPDSGMTQ
jgi:hypothetical protein